MKLCTIFICVFQLTLTATTFSQQKKVSFNLKNISMESLFREIQKQTGYYFVFSYEELGNIKLSKVQADQQEVGQLLGQTLGQLGYTYTFENDIIVVSPKKDLQNQPQVEKRTITGKVTDSDGLSLPGVSVIIKGTTIGVSTDADGKYKLEIPGTKNLTLEFRFVGMKTTEIALKNQTEINVVLEQETSEMEEVVVTGIFRKAKTSYTGAATVVTAEELQQFGNRNLITTLRNIDPSFNIVENNAFGSNPNKLPEVQIRGNSSVPNVNELKDETRVNMNTPLVILDGFESDLQKLLDMNENEVESIVILKDASATSIYGSRGANGVIVITTKSPVMGKLRVSYRGNLNIEVPDLSAYNILEAREKLELEKAVGLWDSKSLAVQRQYNEYLNDINSGVNTYWLAQPLRTGVGQRHNLRLEGGDKTFRYSASVQYNDVQGIMKKSWRKNLNGTINLSYYLKNVKFTNSLMVGINKTSESPYGSFSEYVRMNPYLKTHDEAGNILKTYKRTATGYFRTVTNPLYNSLLNTYETTDATDIINNFSIEWTILQGLIVKGRIGVSKKYSHSDNFKPAEHTDFADYSEEDLFRRGQYKYGTSDQLNLDGSLNISYSRTFQDKHMLYAGCDYNIRQAKSSSYQFLAEGFTNEEFDFLSMALQYAQNQKPSGSESLTRSIGLTASVNYMYDNRYYLDLSGRMDGSSQFGTNKRFAPFWSVGIGWNIHEEKFLKNQSFINFLKLRASTGITGSQNFDSYQALSAYKYYTDKRYYNWLGATMAALGNKDLRWQQKQNYNIGLEVKLWNNRISLQGDFYTETTKDLISSINLPAANGFTSYVENIGKMRNNGIELKASAFLIRNAAKDLSWSVTAALMHNKNKIIEVSQALLDAQKEIEEGEGSNPNFLYKPGYSTRTIWVVPSLGIDPSTGREIYINRNGDFTYTWDARDQVAYGISEPKYQGNISSMLRYKGLSVNLSFRYQWGGQLYNTTLIDKVENANFQYNVDARVYHDRWSKPGDIAAFKGLQVTEKTQRTSRFVENERMFTCQNINVQYEWKSPLLQKTLGMENLTLSGSTSDLFYLSTVKRERGTSYPFSRQFSFSLSATF